jgi:hypothetical protein
MGCVDHSRVVGVVEVSEGALWRRGMWSDTLYRDRWLASDHSGARPR